MKYLVMIIPASVQQDLADCLRGLGQVQGFTFTHVEGHGVQAEQDPFLSTRDRVVGYTPRVRAEVLLDDAHVQSVLDAVRAIKVGEQGLYWVQQVEAVGRIWNSP